MDNSNPLVPAALDVLSKYSGVDCHKYKNSIFKLKKIVRKMHLEKAILFEDDLPEKNAPKKKKPDPTEQPDAPKEKLDDPNDDPKDNPDIQLIRSTGMAIRLQWLHGSRLRMTRGLSWFKVFNARSCETLRKYKERTTDRCGKDAQAMALCPGLEAFAALKKRKQEADDGDDEKQQKVARKA